jgi:hypothetical protein
MHFLSTLKSYFKGQEIAVIRESISASDINIINSRINFKISYRGSLVPFWMDGQDGMTQQEAGSQVEEILGKIAQKIASGKNLVEISQELR